MSSLQVLVATMNEKSPVSLFQRMNLASDALIINQSNIVSYEEYEIKSNKCECYTFNERGLSKSRNNALLRASGDILCIADDDMVYTDRYVEDIINEFSKHPEADAIVFNVDSTEKTRSGKHIDKFKKVNKIESREYGSVHIAFKKDKVLSKNVYFNVLFGSGAYYSCGEDTIFLKELLDKGMCLYKSPIKIATVNMSQSSWFNGYNEKYFFDKGALIAYLYPHIKYLLIILQAFRNSKKRLGSYSQFRKVFKWYIAGADDFCKKKI